MPDQAVGLLYALRFFGRNRQQKIDACSQPASALPCKPCRVTTSLAGGINGAENVRGLPTRAYGNEDVSFDGQGLHLARERLFKAEVIRDSGENRGVRRQGDGRQGLSLKLESSDKLRGKMLRIGRAAAITHQQHLLPAAIGHDSSFGQTPDIFQQFRGKAALYGTAFLNLLAEQLERRVFGYSHFSLKFVAQEGASSIFALTQPVWRSKITSKPGVLVPALRSAAKSAIPTVNKANLSDNTVLGGSCKSVTILSVASGGGSDEICVDGFGNIRFVFSTYSKSAEQRQRI
jgi:hypothetical protein